MTFGTYVDMPLGPMRGGTNDRTGPTLWIVVHTSEPGTSAESVDMAEALARFIATPGTHDANGNPINVASYHLVTDTDRLLRFMPDEKRPNAAGGGNENGLHICFPGQAAQSRDQWLDSISSSFMDQAAAALADWSQKFGIPLVRIGAGDVATKSTKGVCGHVDVTNAFHLSTHTDPGSGFPWDVLLERANSLLEGELANADEIMAKATEAAVLAKAAADTSARIEQAFGVFREREFARDKEALDRLAKIRAVVDNIPNNDQTRAWRQRLADALTDT